MSLNKIDNQIKKLKEKPSLEKAEELISLLVKFLGIEHLNEKKLLNHKSIQREKSRFVDAPMFKNQPAAYQIPHSSEEPLDLKLFWIQKATKANLSWLVAITPNYEDNTENNPNANVGIDFVLDESADKLFVILSNNLNLRVLELDGSLSHTQREIFENWQSFSKKINSKKDTYKALFHQHLWKSFDFEPANKQFYQGLIEQFDHLVDHLKVEFTEEDAKMFTVRMIGRTLFLWFLRKKEFLNPEMKYFDVSQEDDQTTYYKEKLEPLFFDVLNTEVKKRETDDDLTPFLNGGLFEPIETDFYKDEKLTFPKGFFTQFFGLLNKYNFTVDEGTSNYEQVAVDPEMLGRVFENLLASIIDETGKQARKAKGAFYTPREIVDYMCQQSLIEYLKSALSDSQVRDKRVEELVRMDEASFREQDHNKRRDWKRDLGKEEVMDALDNMRVLDPAVGSGAFPMGMLNLLVKVYSRIDTAKEKDLSNLKREILSRSLYGVDIDQMAIQTTRLRAWLSMLVDMENLDKVEPLPNLDFKFVCANTLVSLSEDRSTQLGSEVNLKENLIDIREKYYKATRKKEKKKLREEYLEKIRSGGMFDSLTPERVKQIKEYDPFKALNSCGFYDPELMHGVSEFDVVIANPPYVSTKGRNQADKNTLQKIYGFADDLYSHFYFRGFQLAKDETGILTYISSKTFWTIQTKKNVRELLQEHKISEILDTASPFAAMVDTCVVIAQKKTGLKDYKFMFGDGRENFNKPIKYEIDISLYRDAVNNVFFIPTEFNLGIYHKYNNKVKELMEEWWPKIKTSRKISKHEEELQEYRSKLEPGDIALLGTLTEGGQGLATANNGRFVGVRKGTKSAEKIMKTRPKKLAKVVKEIAELEPSKKYSIKDKSEQEIRDLFDSMKEKHGRDIFGRGYLFRIVSEEEIADVDKLSEEEKRNGIDKEKPHYVPYDKGDRDGNRWWLETPFVIDWSKESVKELQTSTKARWQGYDFYFRNGFCWSDIHTVLIKSRLKSKGVHDVNSMSMFSAKSGLPDWFFVSLLNSSFISNYDFNFINGTSSFQINDARQIPVIIPTKEELAEFEDVFKKAYKIKEKQFAGKFKEDKAEARLDEIQEKLDQLVLDLYGFTDEEKAIIRNS
jgi:hypothetical protein